METIYAHKFGAMKRFSEQDLVDCDTNNWGCVGGYPSSGFLYAYKTGLAEEASFPYKAAVLLNFILFKREKIPIFPI